MNVWSWRQAILGSDLQSTTKLVLLTLATYMNDHGDNCFPSHTTIAANASLSVRAVITHIQLAVEAGFLVKEKRGLTGRIWDANEYHASFPSSSEPNSPQNEGVQDIHPTAKSEPRGEPNSLEGCMSFTQGVNQMHTNSPENSIINSPEKKFQKKLKEKIYSDQFEEFWEKYPAIRRAEKPNAYRQWKIATNKIRHPQMMEALERYLLTKEARDGYAPYPAKWLKNERWIETMIGKNAQPLNTPPLTIYELGGDTQENREFFNILEKIRMKIGDIHFNAWIKPLRLQHKNCTKLTLTAVSPFRCERIKRDYESVIYAATREVWAEITNIEIIARG